MARSRSIRSRLRRFRQVGNTRRLLLFEALCRLAWARTELLFVPFPRIAGKLGAFVAPDQAAPLPATTKEQAELAREVSWAVTRAARHAPFKAVCLPQAIAARRMLRRRGVGSILHFGATMSVDTGRQLEAHAWLDAVGVEVTGYPVAHEFKEIACFV